MAKGKTFDFSKVDDNPEDLESKRVTRDAAEEELRQAKTKNESRQAKADPYGLTGFQRLFADAYCFFLNAEQAYHVAGGKAKTRPNVWKNASYLMDLEKVQRYVFDKLSARREAEYAFGVDPTDAIFKLNMMVRGSLDPFVWTGRPASSTCSPRRRRRMRI